jgi:hypothetical protein
MRSRGLVLVSLAVFVLLFLAWLVFIGPAANSLDPVRLGGPGL